MRPVATPSAAGVDTSLAPGNEGTLAALSDPDRRPPQPRRPLPPPPFLPAAAIRLDAAAVADALRMVKCPAPRLATTPSGLAVEVPARQQPQQPQQQHQPSPSVPPQPHVAAQLAGDRPGLLTLALARVPGNGP